MMFYRKPPTIDLFLLILLIAAFVVFVFLLTGCGTVETITIKEPVEVLVPVEAEREPLPIPDEPVEQECVGAFDEIFSCIGFNIELWKQYAKEMRDELESYNEAIPDPID
jgi:hypothetical protein